MENGRPSSAEPTELPDRHITVNQVVAWNIACFRKAAGMTQAELGERLGWSHTAVSAAERSFDSGRVREFDAHTLAVVATALGVPLLALFLPPSDDGAGARYQLEDGRGMAALMALAMPDTDDDTPVMTAYRERLILATGRYLDEDWTGTVKGWMTDLTSAEVRAQRLERIRWEQDALRAAVADLDRLAEALEGEGS